MKKLAILFALSLCVALAGCNQPAPPQGGEPSEPQETPEVEVIITEPEDQGLALSREKILNSVWNYDYFGDARTIDTHVKKLRNKLGEKGNYIRTIWGMGYKFEVESQSTPG